MYFKAQMQSSIVLGMKSFSKHDLKVAREFLSNTAGTREFHRGPWRSILNFLCWRNMDEYDNGMLVLYYIGEFVSRL